MEGSDATTGATRTVTMGSEELREVLREPLGRVLEIIFRILEQCPPGLSANLIEAGMVLAGDDVAPGGMIIKWIADETGLPVLTLDGPRT